MDFFKTYNGLIIRGSDSGKGDKVILLLHGYQVNIDIWERLTKQLVKKGYRVISLDLLGQGFSGTNEINTMESMADTTAIFMDDLSVKSAVLVGHSMGGYVSLALAEKYPDRVEGICFLNSTPNSDNEQKISSRNAEIKLIQANKLEYSILEGMGKMFSKKNRNRLEDIIGDLSAAAVTSDPKGLIATLEGLKVRKDMNPFLAKYDKPCVFIFGDEDLRVSEEVRNKVMEDHPNFEYHVLEGTAHAAFLEEEDKTVEILESFIKRLQ